MRTFRLSVVILIPMHVTVAQEPVVSSLGQPTAISRIRFSEVGDVVELAHGKVLVSDPTERTLTLVDMSTGRGQAVSGIGSGPREFRMIGPLIPRPDGGATLVDFAQFRLLPVAPDGAVTDVVKYPVELGRTIRATDAQGRFYSDVFPPFGGGSRSDSMWIVRWDPRRGRVDTIGKYDAGISKWTGRPMHAYPAIDGWAVLPGGEIVIAEAATYRVSIWEGARLVHSANVPWQPLRFTAADRLAHQEWAAANPPIPMGGAPASGARRRPLEYVYPVSYPAFVRGQLLVDRQGRLWFEKSRPAHDAVAVFDVLNTSGRLLGRVGLPAGARLAGFGVAAVYLAVPNADEELAIQRHPLPVLPPR